MYPLADRKNTPVLSAQTASGRMHTYVPLRIFPSESISVRGAREACGRGARATQRVSKRGYISGEPAST